MTAAWEALELVRSSGVVLILDGNEIRFTLPPGGIPRAILEKIRSHKTALRALLRALRGTSTSPNDPADELLSYAVNMIQNVADKHPAESASMEARFAAYERERECANDS